MADPENLRCQLGATVCQSHRSKRIEDGIIGCHRGRLGALVVLEYSGRKSLSGVST
jgi:hypothetical protein